MHIRQGWVHAVERFSVHDGPGIRTLVVMKGCPLRCRWCSSPHTQRLRPELLHIKSRCQGCGACIAACRQQAISRDSDPRRVATDRARCMGCGQCVSLCPNRAREVSGRIYSPKALFDEVKKEEAFYRRSGGGVTVGGGEPTQQAPFVAAFLTLCRAQGLHTAMESCAWTSWEKLAPLLELLDLVYMDLKHMDARCHQAWTGAANELILENIRETARRNALILRIPVIPGFNDDEENLIASGRFAKALGGNVLRIELLPYHPFGIHRYDELDRASPLDALEPPSETRMDHLCEILRSSGIDVQIGG